ncbi:MAG: chemotaxis response regulator protein-glutamate methylesterase [Halanaerobiales bacterium]
MIKVLVVDDSSFMRQIFKKTIEKEVDIKVIATAGDGVEALEKIRKLKPDVVTLDVDMPVKNGLETLKEIMKDKKPVPTIMVSAVDSKLTVMKALELGAFDFIPKPDGSTDMSMNEIAKNLILKINAAAHMKARPALKIKPITPPYKNKISKKSSGSKFPILAIGTSSGGPKALKAIIPTLPEDFPAAILIVQHMPAGFTTSFANRLDQDSEISVKEAEQGDILEPGKAFLAPGDYHMRVNDQGKITLDQSAPKWSVRPCVDHMMKSVAENYSDRVVGIILTGMGVDGAEGMKTVKDNGGYGIVEDESTALVYGMPAATIRANAFDEIVPLHQIPFKINDLIERRF